MSNKSSVVGLSVIVDGKEHKITIEEPIREAGDLYRVAALLAEMLSKEILLTNKQ